MIFNSERNIHLMFNVSVYKNDFIEVSSDKENNELIITNKTNLPLNIRFNGQINLFFNNDLQVESNGEVDIITHDNMICLDSVNSCIHFNSNMSKKLRGDNLPTSIEEMLDISKKLAEQKQEVSENKLTMIEQLRLLVDNINSRLVDLESEKFIVDVSKIEEYNIIKQEDVNGYQLTCTECAKRKLESNRGKVVSSKNNKQEH